MALLELADTTSGGIQSESFSLGGIIAAIIVVSVISVSSLALIVLAVTIA